MLSFNAQMRLDNLHIPATEHSPEVLAEIDTGLVIISGDSILENPPLFFQEIYEWLDDYMLHVQNSLTVEFKMNYYNTGTSARFYRLIDKLNDYKKENQEVELIVNWYYDVADDTQMENGIDFARMYPNIINLIPVVDSENSLRKDRLSPLS